MADIYTSPWFDEVREAINRKVAEMTTLPKGSWHVAVDIVGDGLSPYVAEGVTRHFIIRIENGHCAWYREIQEQDHHDLELDFRFVGPATAFDEVASGLLDPIDAALQGRVRVRGDMRFLMRQAEHVKVLLEAYAHGVDTTWPLGTPPYPADSAAAEDARTSNAHAKKVESVRAP